MKDVARVETYIYRKREKARVVIGATIIKEGMTSWSAEPMRDKINAAFRAEAKKVRNKAIDDCLKAIASSLPVFSRGQRAGMNTFLKLLKAIENKIKALKEGEEKEVGE